LNTFEEEYERRMAFARGKAAQAWCGDKTRYTEMDSDLAEEFAKILVEEMYAPHLGCATTEELLSEVAARVDLDYATVRPMDYFSCTEKTQP
jgi:hypothetical protein